MFRCCTFFFYMGKSFVDILPCKSPRLYCRLGSCSLGHLFCMKVFTSWFLKVWRLKLFPIYLKMHFFRFFLFSPVILGPMSWVISFHIFYVSEPKCDHCKLFLYWAKGGLMFTVQDRQVGLELVHQGQLGWGLQELGMSLEDLSFLSKY